MSNTHYEKPDWQMALGHHEELCSERYEAVHKEIRSFKDETGSGIQDLRDDIRDLRIGQRWIIGAVLVWPPLMTTALITLLTGG